MQPCCLECYFVREISSQSDTLANLDISIRAKLKGVYYKLINQFDMEMFQTGL